MEPMIYISLAMNILVLILIVILMSIKSPIVDQTWGAFTAARGILMSIYLSILVVSVLLLFKPAPALVAALLLVQVVYQLTTPFTVGKFSHPVVISNLVISALHIATLVTIYLALGERLLQTS
ncbi:MAG: hypothetical protein F2662_02025 [Actinobacteria bacterium]|uniref:Unannotated protein n=1 Tax=freshwater metagenome TaxID=449393 RepID=A0A6J6N9L8_9ZZZZ|nr:hypothetical protein [Actinomycetota bacterium]